MDLTGIVLALTVFGMTAAPAPPGVTALAASSLAADLAVAGLAAWLGRGPAAAGGSIRPRP